MDCVEITTKIVRMTSVHQTDLWPAVPMPLGKAGTLILSEYQTLIFLQTHVSFIACLSFTLLSLFGALVLS